MRVPTDTAAGSLPWTTISAAEAIPDDHSFALCLTHDVDRPYKTYQSIYYALTERDPSHLQSLLPGRNPYWTFQQIASLEADLGVRSAFYFMDEQRLFRDRPVSEWLSAAGWLRYVGRYDIDDPAIINAMRELERGGWEIGLHGSYQSYADQDRLRAEKDRLESLLGTSVNGGRQHHLNLSIPETWHHHRAIGLTYDSSLGSSAQVGFEHGYRLLRPFDDRFVEFPLTIMDVALPNVAADPDRAEALVVDLLDEAAANQAVMTVLWHPRYLGDDHPEHVNLYRTLIEHALDRDAWVGPPGTLYEHLEQPPTDGLMSIDGRANAV